MPSPQAAPVLTGSVVIAVAEDARSLNVVRHRLLTMGAEAASRVDLVLAPPPPGPGVVVLPEIVWMKEAEIEIALDAWHRDFTLAPPLRLARYEPLTPAVPALAVATDATVVVLPRPHAWAMVDRWWWSGATRAVHQALPGSRLVRCRDTQVIVHMEA